MPGSIGVKIDLGIAVALALFLAICVVAYQSTNQLLATVHHQLATHRVLAEVDDLRHSLQDAETGQRGYLLTADERYLEPYRDAIARIRADLVALRAHPSLESERAAELERVEQLVDAKLSELQHTIDVRRSEGLPAALAIVSTDRGKQIMDELRKALLGLESEQAATLERLDREAEVKARRANLMIEIGGGLVLGLFTFSLFAIHRDVRERREAQDALQRANDRLETRVRERTAEIERSNTTLQHEVAERKAVEAELTLALGRIEKSRDEVLRVFDQLRLGAIVTDAAGRVSLMSRAARGLLSQRESEWIGRHWEELLPIQESERRELATLCQTPPAQRWKVPARVDSASGGHYWTEIEVQDDPLEPERKIFLLYDMSELYDLRRLHSGEARFHGLIGDSAAMRRVYGQIRALARVESTVLIEGETGVGKELVAQAIHRSGGRSTSPFVAVNCAGLTDSLLASQLFGHRRGAFTGAVQDQKGVFEAAEGGTLFLDEIGDVTPNVQTALLRVLQEKEIIRLGESAPRHVDVRVIAATQRDLTQEVAAGRFRADLLYRIRVGRIQVLPLRERREDVPLLVAWFLREGRPGLGKSVDDVSDEAMGRMLAYAWPGNVRELKSAIEFAVIRCESGVVQLRDLPPEILEGRVEEPPAEAGRSLDDARIAAALAHTRGNRKAAAALLGVSRATFYRRLAEMRAAGRMPGSSGSSAPTSS
jgi:transcriptional regulator with PAS, ATPase and Fis domain